MSQPFSSFNNFIGQICTKAVNMSSDVWWIALSNSAPTAGQAGQTYTAGNITEIASGGGYTQGTGIVLTTGSNTNSGGTYTWVATAALFTATGAVAQFDYAILVDTTASAQLFGWYQCASAITMANTDTFQISWSSNHVATWAATS
jgi:hypothetical protein